MWFKNMIAFAVLAVVCIANANASKPTEYSPTVQLKGGKVRGTIQEVYEYGYVYRYEGIRYGRAERFAKPTMAESWEGVYDAIGYKYACPQQTVPRHGPVVYNETQLKTLVSSEDCLFVNVWRPLRDRANRAVMVFIHGGAFTEGTIFTQYYDSRYISLLGDVIVVTVNYRLDVFGFLYTGTDDAPGNAGLYDQTLALRWVQENIAAFGGDPKKVTVFGESAGSFSVGSLILSPLTKGLCSRAIMQSGAPNAWLGSQGTAKSLENADNFAKALNCANAENDKSKTMKCLRSKTIDEILNVTKNSLVNGENFIPVYGDGVEFLPIPPVVALKEGKFNRDIDLMFGVTKNEGSMFVIQILELPQLDPDNPEAMSTLTLDQTKTVIDVMMRIFLDPNPQEVVDFYMRYHNLTENSNKDDMRRAISYVFGDYHLVCPTMFFGESVAKVAKPTQNFYSYRLNKRVDAPVMFCRGWMGVCHAEDVVILFGLPLRLLGIMSNDAEARLSLEMIHTWSNFAKTGKPGKVGHAGSQIEWAPAFDGHNVSPRLLEMGESFSMSDQPFKELCDTFWRPRIFN